MRENVPSVKSDHSIRSIKVDRITFLVTKKCNLACKYCFATPAYKNEQAISKDIMPIDIAIKAIDFCMSNILESSFAIMFFGGEPLLNWDVIVKTVKYANHLSELKKVWPPKYMMVTNGVLLTSNHIDFLANNDFSVTVSLDGNQHINDQQRIFANGLGSYKVVNKNLQVLLEKNLIVKCQATYTRKHIEIGLTPIDVVEQLSAIGLKLIHLVPVATQDYAFSVSQLGQGILPEQFMELGEYGTLSLASDKPILITQVTNILYSILTKKFRKRICNAGIESISIDTNGDIYPCYLLMDSDNLIGNISNPDQLLSNFYLIKNKFKQITHSKILLCSDCKAKELCSSCYGYRYMQSGELGAPGGIICSCYKHLAAGVIMGFEKLISDDIKWMKFIQNIDRGLVFNHDLDDTNKSKMNPSI